MVAANTIGMDLVEKHLHRGVEGPDRKKQRTLSDALAQPHWQITRDRCGMQVMESIPGSSAGSSTDPLPQVPPEPVLGAEQHPEPLLGEPVPTLPAVPEEPEPMDAPKPLFSMSLTNVSQNGRVNHG